MRVEGLEPPRPAPPAPKAGLSTSATPPARPRRPGGGGAAADCRSRRRRRVRCPRRPGWRNWSDARRSKRRGLRAMWVRVPPRVLARSPARPLADALAGSSDEREQRAGQPRRCGQHTRGQAVAGREVVDLEPRGRAQHRSRGYVPQRDAALVERVVAPGGRPREVERGAPHAADVGDARQDPPDDLGLAGARAGVVGEAGGDERGGEVVALRRAQRRAAERRRAACPDGEELVAQRVEDHGGAALARDADAPLRYPEQVVDRAVERVDDPAQAAAAGDVVALLADDRVVGPPLAHDGTDRALGVEVGRADEVGRRALRLEAAWPAGRLVALDQDRGRGAGGLDGDGEQVLVARTHSAGRRSAQGRAASIWAASDSSVASSCGRPASWTPSGSPWRSKPAGTAHAG